jgi:hypothetical protein
VGNVAFPCGTTLGADGDSRRVYYGAADTCIALATASVTELLAWLDHYGRPGCTFQMMGPALILKGSRPAGAGDAL